MKKYKSIWPTDIHVDGKLRIPGDVFEVDEKTQEIKNLVAQGYIEEVKEK